MKQCSPGICAVFSASDGQISEVRRVTTTMNICRRTSPPSSVRPLLLVMVVIFLIVDDVVTSDSK